MSSRWAKVVDGVVVNVILAEQELSWWSDADYILLADDSRVGPEWERIGDEFRPPKPFESWTWDSSRGTWVAPTPSPQPEQDYYWDEATSDWAQYPEELRQPTYEVE